MKARMQHLMQRFQTAHQSWTQVPDAARARDEVWFAGMVVSPAEFSGQLAGLQVSLQRENAPANGQTALH